MLFFLVMSADKYSTDSFRRYECHFVRITSNINTNKLLQLTVSPSRLKSPYHSFEKISRSFRRRSTTYTPISRKGSPLKCISARTGSLFRLCSRYRPKIEFQVSFQFPVYLGCGLNPGGITDCRRKVVGYVNVISKQAATSLATNEGRIMRKSAEETRIVMEFGRYYPKENKDALFLPRPGMPLSAVSREESVI